MRGRGRTFSREWVPRLSPGIIAAAFHGVIRTAHAVRSLDADGDAGAAARARRGSGVLGGDVQRAPGVEATRGRAQVARRRRSPTSRPCPAEKRQSYGNIVDRLKPLDAFAPFAGVADLVDATGDSSAFISNLTETFAHAYLVNVPRGGSVITYLHGVTGPSAMRLLIPHLDAPRARRDAPLRLAGRGGRLRRERGSAGCAARSAARAGRFDDLIDRAIATRDEHAIKFTEACRRENALNPKPVYFAAARDAVSRLG